MTPPDTPSLVERLRELKECFDGGVVWHVEGAETIQEAAAQIAALQSTNDHLHEGLEANAKEMADMVENLTTLRADNARLKRELEAAREGWRTDMENIPKGKGEPYFLGWCPSIFEGEEPELVMCYWSNVMGRIEAQGQTLAKMDVELPIAFKVITPPVSCPTPPPSPTEAPDV